MKSKELKIHCTGYVEALEGRDLSVLLTVALLDTAPDMQQAKRDYMLCYSFRN